MSYQVLARKWRPRTFPEMVGQGHVLRALINALDNDRLHHAFLFTGTRGVGKTTVARILAKSLNCEQGVSSTPCGECESCRAIDEGRFVDLIEVDAASRTKVEDTRELLENVQYAPTRGRYKVYLIDEVHMLSTHSFNALLKTLEEPPPHVKFLLATTDPQRLPVTILSRCLQFNLKRLPVEAIRDHLAQLLQQENVEADPAALLEVARAADGSMRDALSLLDQAIAFGNGRLALAEVREMLGSVDRDRVFALLEALAAGDGGALLHHSRELAEFAPDFGAVLAELGSALHGIALQQSVPDGLGDEEADRDRLADLAARLAPEDVQLYYQIAATGRRDLPLAPDPRTGFEMTLLRMLAFRPAEGANPVSPPPRTAPAPRGNGPSRTAPVSEPPNAAAQGNGPSRTVPVSEPPNAAAQAKPSPRPRSESAPPEQDAPREAEPEPEPAPPSPVERAPAAGLTNWAATVDALRLTGVVHQIAVNSTPALDEGGRIELVADPACAGLLSDKRRQQLEAALAEARGGPVRLTIRIGGSGGETPAQQARRAADERMRSAEASIENDADLQNIIERFDGKIEPGSIRPAD